LAVLAVAVWVASDPVFVRRYLTALLVGPNHPPLWFYRPSERIAGRDAGGLPRATPLEAALDPVALERAADYAAARNSHALLVARHGHLVFERYWSGTDFDTPVSIRGFGNTLAALALGAAFSERRLRSLAEPAAEFLPAWSDVPRREITLEDVLQSSSGLEPTADSLAPWSAAMRQKFGSDLTAAAQQPRLAHRAGIDWTAQAIDPQLLVLILERATGMRYAEWLSTRIWKPIGAGDAAVFLDHADGTAQVDFGLIARQGDWLRIGELLVDDGVFEGDRVLPLGWVNAMRTPARGNRNFGFQLWLGSPYVAAALPAPMSEPYAADDVVFLGGDGRNRLWVVRSLGLVILRTGAAPSNPADWDDARLPNLVIRAVRDRPAAPRLGAPVDLSTLVPNH